MLVPILSSSAWREFRGIPGTPGINLTTHLANVADASGKLHNCYVKLLKPNTPALLCEAVGWALAHSIGVPAPAFGAIVLVPLDDLRRCMALPDWTDGLTSCAAWCSEVVLGKSVRQVHRWAFWLSRKKCLQSKDVRCVAALDVWADNRDRNFGNVIRSSGGGYIAIDHETLLHDLLWVPAGLSYVRRSLLDEAKEHLPLDEFKRFNIDMAIASENHGPGLSSIRTSLGAFIDGLYPHAAPGLGETIIEYLGKRARTGWLADEIGVIA